MNTPNQPSKFMTKNWIEINDSARGTYNTNNQFKFKTKMLKLRLCEYGDTYILVQGTISASGPAASNRTKKKLKIMLHLLIHKRNKQHASR